MGETTDKKHQEVNDKLISDVKIEVDVIKDVQKESENEEQIKEEDGDKYEGETKKEDAAEEDSIKEDDDTKEEDDEKEEGEKNITDDDNKIEDAPFAKKKKTKQEKIRRVDMEKFYPEESVSSLDVKKEKKPKEPKKILGDDETALAEHSDEKIDPTKDYSKEDPSFLDDFDTSEGEVPVVMRKFDIEKEEIVLEQQVEEEEDFQQEIYVQPPEREPSDRVYDLICDLETPISTDESFSVPKFKYIDRRNRCTSLEGKIEEDKLFGKKESDLSVDVSSNSLKYLMDNIAPALKKTLIETATYQPENAVRYMTYSLLQKTKDREELGLDPDPHLIQALVDSQKKKKRSSSKKPDIFLKPFGESEIVVSKTVVPIQSFRSSSTDEDPSHIRNIERKFTKAKTQMITEEKEKRSRFNRRAIKPGTCLGPTTLPLTNPP